VAFAGYRWFAPHPKADPLVAVLPFDNLSPDPQLGYFADGLSEDILNALIRGGGVRVTAGTSSFTFRGAAKAKAGEALKADYLLDGSVLRQGGRMRVNARLTDVARHQTLWSESYDRDIGQGLQMEDEVAGRVAAALRLQLASAGPAARAIDPEAYDLYLKGREATKIHILENLKRGHDLLEAAVVRAPDFAPAWFELAKNCWRRGYLEPLPEQQRGFVEGRQAARRAIALDPRSGGAYGVIAQMIPPIGHWREIDDGLARGLALSPNEPNLLVWRGTFLGKTGRLKAARDLLQRSYALDPLDLFANHSLWQVLTAMGAFPQAQVQATRLTAIWPEQLAGYWDQYWLFVAMGRFTEAGAWLADPAKRPHGEADEFAVLAEAMAAGASRARPRIEAAGRRLLWLARQGMGYAGNSMLALAALGLFDEALETARALYLQEGSLKIDRSIEFNDNGRFPLHGEPEAFLLFHVSLTPLRRSGRLDRIFAGLGLTAYWREAGGPDR
jgi:adenylate cyclase